MFTRFYFTTQTAGHLLTAVRMPQECQQRAAHTHLGFDALFTPSLLFTSQIALHGMSSHAHTYPTLEQVQNYTTLEECNAFLTFNDNFNGDFPSNSQEILVTVFRKHRALSVAYQRELDEARSRVREVEAELNEAYSRARDARAELEEARSRPVVPLLSELTPQRLGDFKDALAEDIENVYPKMVSEVNTLLEHDWRDLLHHVVDSLAAQRQRRGSSRVLRDCVTTKVNVVCVNGDIQRGKSTVEALYAAIIFEVHRSNLVADKCCTMIATQLQSWAMALKDTVNSKAVRANTENGIIDGLRGEDEGHGVQAIGAEDIVGIPCERFAGRNGREEVKNCMRSGGAVVIFRTDRQYANFDTCIADVNDTNTRGVNDKSIVPMLILDESDKFVGDDKSKHTRELMHLMGMSGRRQVNLPALVVFVSATNMGPCYWVWRRMHTRRSGYGDNEKCFELVDVIGFKPASELEYRCNGRSFIPDDATVEVPRPGEEYVTDQILDIWQNTLSTPFSLLVDTATTRVNYNVEHNMLDHVAEIESKLEERRLEIPEENRPDPAPAVVVYVHGGHSTHLGMMGIQLINQDHLFDRVQSGELPSTALLMGKLEQSIRDASASEYARAQRLAADGAAESDVQSAMHKADKLLESANNLDDNYNITTDCLEVHHLSQFAWYVKDEALRRGHYTEKQLKGFLSNAPDSFEPDDVKGKSPFSTSNLSLILFIIRKFIQADVPIVVVGSAMIRRCMSIVAVDFLRAGISVEEDGAAYDVSCPETGRRVYIGQPKAIAVVTHMLCTKCVNSPEGAQINGRSFHNLVNFNVAHPELAQIKHIVVSDVSTATLAYRSWNQLSEFRSPFEQRRSRLLELKQSTTGSSAVSTIRAFQDSLTSPEQRELFDKLCNQFNSCADSGDKLCGKNQMFAIACTLARLYTLPISVMTMIQQQRNPMFQSKCGSNENDLGNLHANLCMIRDGRRPLSFRHAQASCRSGNGGGQNVMNGFNANILNWLAAHNIRANPDGSMPPDAPESWTIFWALRAANPHAILPDGLGTITGYSPLRINHKENTNTYGCGLGLSMNNLYKAGLIHKATVMRPRPPPPPGAHGMVQLPQHEEPRSITVWWLAPGVLVQATSSA